MNTINWTKSTVSDTFRTQRFGNLMADTTQGEVYPDTDGTWSGWYTNHSDSSKTKFRLGFGNKAAAVRWANAQLRANGVK